MVKKALKTISAITVILVLLMANITMFGMAYYPDDEPEPEPEQIIIIEREYENINVNVTIEMPEVPEMPEQGRQETISSSVSEGTTFSATTRMEEVEIIRQEPSGLEQVIIDLFGEYNPIIYKTVGIKEETVLMHNSLTGNMEEVTIEQEVISIEKGFNWSWLTGVILFTLVLYSFFRCIGGILKWK